MCERGRHGAEPIVLSVDTALRSGARNSFNVIQAWAFDGENHLLREQFRAQCTYEVLEETFCAMVRKLRCYAAIIEETANGPPLIRCAERLGILVVPVQPSGSKAERLGVHSALVRQGCVHIARHLYAEFTDEVDNHPRGGTDQTDCFSQYLAKRPPAPRLQPQNQRGVAAVVLASQVHRNRRNRIIDGAAISLGSSAGNYAPPHESGWHTLRSSGIG
jgi:phage terminase large subunit-like protein